MSAATATAVRDLGAFRGVVLEGADAARRDLGRLDGRRVAVVGPGVRLAPLLGDLAGRSASVKVFHTEPAWVLPKLACVGGGGLRAVGRVAPVDVHRSATRLLASTHLRCSVPDAWSRRQLTPTVPPRRSNVAYSTSYYSALRRVELVFWPVSGACRDGLRTADGIEHHVDVVVVL